jgi:hypothetical protein
MCVSLAVSTRSPIHVVLSSTLTSQSSFISSTRVYCPYPNLITNKYCLRTNVASPRAPRRTSACYKITHSNRSWKKSCGPVCPAIIRKTVGDQGIASFQWNPVPLVPESRHRGTDYLLAASTVCWKFLNKCRNRKCPQYVPDPYRHKLK